MSDADVVVIGGGAAALAAVVHLPAKMRVVLVSPSDDQPATAWAKGGIAAATGAHDAPEFHLADTIAASGELADREAAGVLVAEAPALYEELVALGVPFDEELGREGGHRRARIHHARGDRTGAAILAALRAHRNAVRARLVHARLTGLVVDDAGVRGVDLDHAGHRVRLRTPRVVLATGGYGALWDRHTTPSSARGEGLVVAYLAGATLVDLEFVQFHPTALALGHTPLPLATEALRGRGAHLVDALGQRLTAGPDGDLAPRDVLARTVASHTGPAFLDTRALGGALLAQEFPSFCQAVRSHGLDPETDLVPVVPALHYTMGGVLAGTNGRTTVPGLWAVGEVACTGVHGANRLASNSLVEALVFGRKAALDVADTPSMRPATVSGCAALGTHGSASDLARVRGILETAAGVTRSRTALRVALEHLTDAPEDSLLGLARLILESAVLREESIGSHWRSDAEPGDPYYRIAHTRGTSPRREPRSPWIS